VTTPVRFRQADITRALKAAKAAGFDNIRVTIAPDGTIEVHVMAENLDHARFAEGVELV